MKFIQLKFFRITLARKRAQMKLYQFHFNPLIYYTAQNSLISRLFQIFSEFFQPSSLGPEKLYIYLLLNKYIKAKTQWHQMSAISEIANRSDLKAQSIRTRTCTRGGAQYSQNTKEYHARPHAHTYVYRNRLSSAMYKKI